MTEQSPPAERRITKLHAIVFLQIGDEQQMHEVDVIHPDKLRGEQAGAQLKIGAMNEAPLTYTTLWVWAACRRLDIVGREINAHRFLNEVCLDVQTDEEPADPTQRDPATT